MGIVTTWDGDIFDQMEEEDALKLEKADKLQIIRDGCVDGLSLKHRADFTGYQTREVRADKAPAPKPPVKKAPKKKTTAKKSKK